MSAEPAQEQIIEQEPVVQQNAANAAIEDPAGAYMKEQNGASNDQAAPMMDFDFGAPTQNNVDVDAKFEAFSTQYSKEYITATSLLSKDFKSEDIESFVKNVALATPTEQVGKISFQEAVANFNNDANTTKGPHDHEMAKIISEHVDVSNSATESVDKDVQKNNASTPAKNFVDQQQPDAHNPASPVGGPNFQGAAAGGGALLGGAIGGLAKLATSVVTAPANAIAGAVAESAARRATNENVNAILKGDESINKQKDYLRELATDIKTMPPSDMRDARVEEFADKSVTCGKDINKQAQKMSRLNADPNNKSRHKLDQDGVEDSANKHGDDLQDIVKDVKDAVKGDKKNESKIEEAQAKIQEALKVMIEAIKKMFAGFTKGNKAAPAP